jgi:hypothetical protein
LVYLAILVGLGFASHFAGMLVLNALLERCKDLHEFTSELLKQVYMLIGIVLATWLIAGSSSFLFTTFVFGLFVTFLRLDMDSVDEYLKDKDQ